MSERPLLAEARVKTPCCSGCGCSGFDLVIQWPLVRCCGTPRRGLYYDHCGRVHFASISSLSHHGFPRSSRHADCCCCVTEPSLQLHEVKISLVTMTSSTIAALFIGIRTGKWRGPMSRGRP